jgi:hypothetical protein
MLPADLVADALTRAESFPADVHKAALLWISRVQTVVAPESALRTLAAALMMSSGVADTHQLGFEELSRLVVAAVAPEHLVQLPPVSARGMFHTLPDRLARVMSQHGHDDYLRTYVLHDAPLDAVPLDGIRHLLAKEQDEDKRRVLVRRAVQVWGARDRNRTQHPPRDQFLFFFRATWKILPAAEALATLREMIDRILREPDSGVNGRVGEARFTSTHAIQLFESFDLLWELDRERAQELIETHPELARALERYPKGLLSMQEEAEAERRKMPPPDPKRRGGFIIGGSRPEDLDYGRALLGAQNTGDFTKPLEYAAARYREDANPDNRNSAPKAFWPSGAMYRAIFYDMGKALGEAAEPKLDSVPDAELRLFAQIELAAALCSFPELTCMTQHLPGWRARPIRAF